MDFNSVFEQFPKLLDGAGVTLLITAQALALGLVLALPLALGRLSKNPLIQWPVYVFVLYFRGTPLLVQLFLIYYGSGQFRPFLQDWGLWGYFREAWFCAVLTLTLNTSAYTAEIFRGALQAVPRGDREAAMAVGMSRWTAFHRVVMPKAFRIALPAYSNEVIFMLQATSLVSVITILDLTGMAQRMMARSFAVYETYIVAALMYLVMTYTLVFLFRRLEQYLGVQDHDGLAERT